mgnify:CR=1 FL=1|jgi:hypothetical protein
MNKYIELNTVHFVSTNGITLTRENPRIEATEENLKKLESYIDKKFLKVVREDEITEFQIVDEIIVPDNIKELSEAPSNVKRIEFYTKDDIKDLNKKELLEIADELGLEVKSNIKVAELKELILSKEV